MKIVFFYFFVALIPMLYEGHGCNPLKKQQSVRSDQYPLKSNLPSQPQPEEQTLSDLEEEDEDEQPKVINKQSTGSLDMNPAPGPEQEETEQLKSGVEEIEEENDGAKSEPQIVIEQEAEEAAEQVPLPDDKESQGDHNSNGDEEEDRNQASTVDDETPEPENQPLQASEEENKEQHTNFEVPQIVIVKDGETDREEHVKLDVPKIVIHKPDDEEETENDNTESIRYGDKDGIGGGEIMKFTRREGPAYIVEAHEVEREGLDELELTWSDELANFAAENAAKCHKSSLHYLHVHTDVEGVPAGFPIIGENRFFGDTSAYFSDALYGWADIEKVRVYGLARAQLFSKTITHVGCGKAWCPHVGYTLTVPQPKQGKGSRKDINVRIYCEYAPGYERDKEPS